MKSKLLDYLCCPSCRADLVPDVRSLQDEEVETGSLACKTCRRSFEIRSGIPRFTPPELSDKVRRNVGSFGYEWSWLSSLSEKNETEFLSYLGRICPESFKSRVVLDAGCGMGKFLYLSGKYGAKDVIGVDLADRSVEAAYNNTRHMANVHVVQADLFHLPLKPCFDFVYSIGVLHHLSFPQEGFQLLVEHLKDGGAILAWVYGYEGNELYIRFLDPVRKITCRMPLWSNKVLAALLAFALWIPIMTVYVPLETVRIKRLPFHDYFIYFHKLGFHFFWGTVFDKLIPQISNYYRNEEFMSWFSKAKLRDISITQRNANSWSGHGVKL
jgi:SAM-dependent methyltransferase